MNNSSCIFHFNGLLVYCGSTYVGVTTFGAAARCKAGYPMFSIESASSETESEMKLIFKKSLFEIECVNFFQPIKTLHRYLSMYLV